jgi:ABC-type lipoprotein release transport system permease subunit
MALGAQAHDVRRLVLADGVKLAAVGIGAGLAGALALTRVLTGFLYEVSPADPPTLAAVVALLTGSALLASYLPARRAARVDPSRALREE